VYNDAHDNLTFEIALAELVKAGYPAALLNLSYDATYPIRGLILEIKTGNFLKCDSFGHVSKCYHGSREIPKKMMAELYPSLMIDPTNTARYYSVDTLYSVCEAGLYRQMVDFLEKSEVDVSFINMFQDVRDTVDRIHRNGMLK
jgi:HAD superfamily 5'-nucleotidase-like hydrolase